MARSKKSNSATSASAEETGGCLLVPTAPFLALVGSEISKLDLISTTTSTKVPKKKAKQTITKAAKKEKPKPAANTIDNGLKPPECISTIPIEIEVSVPTVVSHPASSKAPKQKKKKTKRAIDHTRDESVLKNAENTDDGLLAITASISAMSIMGSKDPNPSLVVPISFDQATPPVESTKTPSQRRRERQKDRIREMQKANLERDAEGEFSRYSNGGNVSSWRRLCEDVGIEERLTSISQCKKVCGCF